MRLAHITILTVLVTFSIANISFSQSVGVNDDGSSPNVKAMLDVKSNTKGVLIPRMSTTDRLAITPMMTEQGLMVYDTSVNAFFYHTGSDWKEVSEALWMKDPIGINRASHIGINAIATSNNNLYVERPFGVTGADTSTIFAYRGGDDENSPGNGGGSFALEGIDAAIKGYSDYGNPFTAGVAGYGYLDYQNSAALIGSNYSGNVYGILGFRDTSSTLYAGYFKGNTRVVGNSRIDGDARIVGRIVDDLRIDDRLGVGIAPSTSFTLNVQSSTEDRTGYFYNTKSSTSTTFGIFGGAYGTGSGAKRGGSFDAVGGTGTNIGMRALAIDGTTNIGVYGYASGGTTNWAGHFDSGDVIIDDRLGIGTQTIPTGTGLYVMSQDIRMEGDNDFFNVVSTGATNPNGIRFYDGNSFDGALFYESGDHVLNITGSSNTAVLVTDFATNTVGIGTFTPAPGYKLSVDGKIISEELRIRNSTNWPDYVFSEDYNLMSLTDLEKAINTHQHLPNIPSAAEVETEGILVGEMQKRMMQKIEELTLYVIDINKQNQALNSEVKLLKEEIEELKQNK